MYSLKYKVTTSTCDSEGRLKLYQFKIQSNNKHLRQRRTAETLFRSPNDAGLLRDVD